MFDSPVKGVMQRKVLCAPADTTVAKAAKQMAARNVGAMMVVDGERLVGIFTERDLLSRVVAAGLDPGATRLEAVMTRDPHTLDPDTPFGYALVLMNDKGFRHLPVVEAGKAVGMISARSAMDPELEEFASETNRRKYWERVARQGKAKASA